jgi:cytochrome c peroxidase
VADTQAMKVVDRVRVTDDKRPAAVQRGQALFFSSARAELSRDRWIGCASCHFDGGIDGRTWNTSPGPRNTQALFSVHETHPLHWSADRASVQDFQKTIQNEMGGKGLPVAELDDLAAFVNSLRLPPNPFREMDGSLSAAARRGRQVFESPKTQCAACHPAPLYTDRKLHDVGTGEGAAERMGNQFDTPSLRGIYATAPYLHDGSADTLKNVLLAKNARDRHGVTSHLSAQEVADLIAFLRSL